MTARRSAPRRSAPRHAPLVAWKDQPKLDAARAAGIAKAKAESSATKLPQQSAEDLLRCLAQLGAPRGDLIEAARILRDLGFTGGAR